MKFSELRKWKAEIMDISQTDHDGIKEVIVNVSGNEVFGTLKFESGTHRVQRVPETESEAEFILLQQLLRFFQKHQI